MRRNWRLERPPINMRIDCLWGVRLASCRRRLADPIRRWLPMLAIHDLSDRT